MRCKPSSTIVRAADTKAQSTSRNERRKRNQRTATPGTVCRGGSFSPAASGNRDPCGPGIEQNPAAQSVVVLARSGVGRELPERGRRTMPRPHHAEDAGAVCTAFEPLSSPAGEEHAEDSAIEHRHEPSAVTSERPSTDWQRGSPVVHEADGVSTVAKPESDH